MMTISLTCGDERKEELGALQALSRTESYGACRRTLVTVGCCCSVWDLAAPPGWTEEVLRLVCKHPASSPSDLKQLSFFPIVVLASSCYDRLWGIPTSWNHFDDPTIVPGTRFALLARLFTPIVRDGKIG